MTEGSSQLTRSRMEAMAALIPKDVLLYNILPRLPTKSVARFMSISKDLYSFLSSNKFRRMHSRYIDHHTRNHDIFLVNMTKGSLYQHLLGVINCGKPNNLLTHKLYKPPKIRKTSQVKFLTSFHGLVCLHIEWKDLIGNAHSHDFILWNPVTGEHKILSRPPKSSITKLDMFYSSCEDDYKLVSVVRRDFFHIYSLKSDSWKTVGSQGPRNSKPDNLSRGICLNENLYFVQDYEETCSVIRFDTKTETFTEMKGAPDLSEGQKSMRFTLMVKEGCLHVSVTHVFESISDETTMFIELWKINEEGNWRKMETYRLDPGCMDMCPLHLMSNGHMLMLNKDVHWRWYGYSILYDVHLKKNRVKMNKPQRKGKGTEQYLPVADKNFSEIVRYNETLLSPNQYSE